MSKLLLRCLLACCLVVLAGCPKSASKGSALDETQYAYSAAIRWGDFEGAYNLVDPKVREEHPLAALLPCDNVFAIESRWYRDNPLVIRGPGAGRDVTAGAIQSDINRLAQLL